jgi:hypothetical protein
VNKRDLPSMVLKKEEERGREMLAPPFTRVFKTDPTLVTFKILEKTLIL